MVGSKTTTKPLSMHSTIRKIKGGGGGTALGWFADKSERLSLEMRAARRTPPPHQRGHRSLGITH